MSAAPGSGVPELAGLATYQEAARIGYAVDENVRRLLRYQWTERRLMTDAARPPHRRAGLGSEVRLRAPPVAGRGARGPAPPPHRRDATPGAAARPRTRCRRSSALLEEALRSGDAVELLAGTLRRGAAMRLAAGLSGAPRPPPTRWSITRPGGCCGSRCWTIEEALGWSEAALAATDRAAMQPPRGGPRPGSEHLGAYLDAAGGIAGPAPRIDGQPLPAPARSRALRARPPPAAGRALHGPLQLRVSAPRGLQRPRGTGRRAQPGAALQADARDGRAGDDGVDHGRSGSDQPWEFHLDYSRQLWDETRHAMMGSVAFEARGVDWTRIPLNVGFSLRLNLHADPLERQTMLYAIEQSLMPADTGKRFEYQTAVEAGDPLSAHFHDYDWADEVLHAQIGRRWLKHEGISAGAGHRAGAGRSTSGPGPRWTSIKHSTLSATGGTSSCSRVLGQAQRLAPGGAGRASDHRGMKS